VAVATAAATVRKYREVTQEWDVEERAGCKGKRKKMWCDITRSM